MWRETVLIAVLSASLLCGVARGEWPLLTLPAHPLRADPGVLLCHATVSSDSFPAPPRDVGDALSGSLCFSARFDPLCHVPCAPSSRQVVLLVLPSRFASDAFRFIEWFVSQRLVSRAEHRKGILFCVIHPRKWIHFTVQQNARWICTKQRYCGDVLKWFANLLWIGYSLGLEALFLV